MASQKESPICPKCKRTKYKERAMHYIFALLSELRSSLKPEDAYQILTKVHDQAGNQPSTICYPELSIQEFFRASRSPERFGDLYCYLQEQSEPVLESLLHTIKLLKEDARLCKFLEHHCRKLGPLGITSYDQPTTSKHVKEITDKDITELCDRLVKAVELAKGKKGPEKLGSEKLFPVKVTDWASERPHMTLDFINDPSRTSFELVPAGSQESIILDDLLSCFLGINGHYIFSEPLSAPLGPRTFRISDHVDTKLRELSLKALTLASHYSVIIRFIQSNRLLDCGRVNQALSAAMEAMIQEYMEFVVQLETEKNKGKLNIHSLWYHIQPVCHTLEKLAEVATSVSLSGARGGKTLSILHDVTVNSVSESSEQQLFSYLTSRAAIPYMDSVRKWIFQGIIHDSYGEFMIVGNSRLQSTRDQYSDEYWVKRYQVRSRFVPNFLEKVQERILDSGKYLNVVRECINTRGSLPLANEEVLEYSLSGSQYLEAIDKAYKFASSSLLDLLIKEYRIVDRIKSVKRYLLLQQGDFVIQMLDMCEEELLKPISDVIPSRLSTLLEMAIRIPSTNDDIYRDNIVLNLKPHDLTYQIFKILRIPISEVQELRSPDQNTVLTGFDAFTLGLECNWPVSLIFNYKVMLCYQLIFRHLMYCKYIEKLLSRVWVRDKSMSSCSPSLSRGYTKAFFLRAKMIFCIHNLEYYMMEEAIEPNWIEFIHAVNMVESVDDILKLHWSFLEKCMKDCMLTQPLLIKIFRKLLAVCKDFATFVIDSKGVTQTYSNNKSFSEYIDHFDHEFERVYLSLLKAVQELSICDIADKVINILYRQNYNYHFSEKLHDVDYMSCL